MNPANYPPGACMDCIRDYANCKTHRDRDRARDQQRTENIRRLLEAQRQRDLAAICLRYELESDEAGSRWDKAERILANSRR